MKKEITLDLHREEGTDNLVLDVQDAFKYIGEGTTAERMLLTYLSVWCDWLNYHLTHSTTCNGNIEEAQMRGWLLGYNCAKGIDEQEFHYGFVLTMRGYRIVIYKPFKI